MYSSILDIMFIVIIILYSIVKSFFHFFTGVALLGANSDMNEASSLTFENDIIDIYSNNWGPFDSGDIVEGPGELTRLALQSGADTVILQLFTRDGDYHLSF